MGPRLISRGVIPQDGEGILFFDASMGPRLISRGVAQANAIIGESLKLQWGRGSLAAAWGAKMFAEICQQQLQWGRGSLAAACRIKDNYDDLKKLQWGRGSLAAA